MLALALFFFFLDFLDFKLFFLQNYRYLDLLSVLCVCDGVAIPDNQTYIAENWLMKDQVIVHNAFSVKLNNTVLSDIKLGYHELSAHEISNIEN